MIISEMKNEICISCGTPFKQWIHSHKEDCNLCRIAKQLERLCELVELR
jgi:hypothetical protein